MQAIARLQKISSQCEAMGLAGVARIIDCVSRFLFSAAVPGKAKVGCDVFFHHSGLGVVINRASVIEDRCEIGVHVVLAGRAPIRGAPYLERDVIVHAGAKLIGPIRIGEGSVVAANAVVVADIPPRSLAAGAPATVKRSEIDSAAYRHDSPPRDRRSDGPARIRPPSRVGRPGG